MAGFVAAEVVTKAAELTAAGAEALLDFSAVPVFGAVPVVSAAAVVSALPLVSALPAVSTLPSCPVLLDSGAVAVFPVSSTCPARVGWSSPVVVSFVAVEARSSRSVVLVAECELGFASSSVEDPVLDVGLSRAPATVDVGRVVLTSPTFDPASLDDAVSFDPTSLDAPESEDDAELDDEVSSAEAVPI
ncbi:hypothetical protein [Mycolicibacterium sp. 050158]|uniref:hypothetical protein n=1 Tax=Mycolicibacterium sp. 050158 TaxID=3090602 RepID=UPI00299EE9D4|nr:hypothetical protein [Mycolicibacterium sp. 050158]MDX1888369.1 hypothetical protein [Mycolicibacterium sp. 050158]